MLNHHDQAEKHLRALHRELACLHEQRRHPPVHELIPPIQRGWKCHFVLTPAARLRPDAATLTDILDHLNTVQYFWRPDFRHTRRQRRRRRGTATIEQELLAIRAHEWERGPVPPDWPKYFRREFVPAVRLLSGWPDRRRVDPHYPRFVHAGRAGYEWGYAFRFPSWFELKVEKHWLTHCIEIEPGIAGRIAEIERWMDFHHGYKRFQRLKGRSQFWSRRNHSAWRRLERQVQREMRTHFGFLDREAAEDIPSTKPCGGHGGWDVFSRLADAGYDFSFFAVVRLEILRLQTPDTRPGGLTGYRHPGQGSQALTPRGRTFTGSRRALPYGPCAPATVRRCRPTVRGSSKRAGSTPAGFLRKKTPGALARAARPILFVDTDSRGSEIRVTS